MKKKLTKLKELDRAFAGGKISWCILRQLVRVATKATQPEPLWQGTPDRCCCGSVWKPYERLAASEAGAEEVPAPWLQPALLPHPPGAIGHCLRRKSNESKRQVRVLVKGVSNLES